MLVAPTDKDTVARERPTLKWNAAACADSYRVIIKERKGGAVVADVSGIAEPEYRSDVLERGKQYQWQVIAVNAFGETASEEWTFRINP